MTVKLEVKNTITYDDLPPTPLLVSRVAANAPTLTPFLGNVQQYTFLAGDEAHSATEITHDYHEGTDIKPHVHWATNGTDVTDRYVKWEIEYTLSNGNEAFGAPIVITTETLIPANTPAKTYFITGFSAIDGTNLKIGAYILWRFRRIASTGLSPSTNPFGLAVGFHMQKDAYGSRYTYSKR